MRSSLVELKPRVDSVRLSADILVIAQGGYGRHEEHICIKMRVDTVHNRTLSTLLISYIIDERSSMGRQVSQ